MTWAWPIRDDEECRRTLCPDGRESFTSLTGPVEDNVDDRCNQGLKEGCLALTGLRNERFDKARLELSLLNS